MINNIEFKYHNDLHTHSVSKFQKDLKMIISKDYDYYFIKIKTYEADVKTGDIFVFTQEKQYPFSVFVDIIPVQLFDVFLTNNFYHYAAIDNIHFFIFDFEEIKNKKNIKITEQISLKYETKFLSVYVLIKNQMFFDDFFDFEIEDPNLIIIKRKVRYGLITHNQSFANSRRYEYFSNFDLQKQIFELMLHVNSSNDKIINKEYVEKRLNENRMKYFGHMLVNSFTYELLADKLSDKKVICIYE